MNTTHAIYQTDLPGLKFVRRGKVRDLYDLGEHLLIVATDRLSAYDVVMPTPIPGKGKVLTQISNFWFSMMSKVVENHLVATSVEDFPAACRPHADLLRGRSVVVKKTSPLPVECVARGYLSGSGWVEYGSSRTVCGIPLPGGLVESSKLPEPIFTPATKAEEGHDENIPFEKAKEMAGPVMEEARDRTLDIYRRAAGYAETRGIVIADTKMEFGMIGDRLIIIDELLTPDSSRFWPRDRYRPGGPQESFDKQYVRDYLVSIGFNKRPPGPVLPPEVVVRTSELYRHALVSLTGRDLQD